MIDYNFKDTTVSASALKNLNFCSVPLRGTKAMSIQADFFPAAKLC
jgi:hypothetical protein